MRQRSEYRIAAGKPVTAKLSLGLRPPFYAEARCGAIPIDWLELITENFMVPGGQPLRVIEDVRNHYPIALHGVSMNLGGTDVLSESYLLKLKKLKDSFEPLLISDHLCWTRHDGHHLHDLLPLPYTNEVAQHVADRIARVQDVLSCRIAIENLSGYVEFDWSDMPEWEFLVAVAERADCLLLIDLNNVVVSARNHGFDPYKYLQAIPPERVAQHHIAGHSTSGTMTIDTHDHDVPDSVFELYRQAQVRFGAVPVSLERDDNIPALKQLLSDLDRVRAISATVMDR